VAAARAAGLPDIILHGTATLAKAVSSIIDTYAAGDPRAVERVACSTFSAMVRMPSTIELHIHDVQAVGAELRVHFTVVNGEGKVAIRGGYVQLRDAAGATAGGAKL
jgi:acyl dehydratase